MMHHFRLHSSSDRDIFAGSPADTLSFGTAAYKRLAIWDSTPCVVKFSDDLTRTRTAASVLKANVVSSAFKLASVSVTLASLRAVSMIFFACSFALSKSVLAFVRSCVLWFLASSISSAAACFSETAFWYSDGSSTFLSCNDWARAKTPSEPVLSGPSN